MATTEKTSKITHGHRYNGRKVTWDHPLGSWMLCNDLLSYWVWAIFVMDIVIQMVVSRETWVMKTSIRWFWKALYILPSALHKQQHRYKSWTCLTWIQGWINSIHIRVGHVLLGSKAELTAIVMMAACESCYRSHALKVFVIRQGLTPWKMDQSYGLFLGSLIQEAKAPFINMTMKRTQDTKWGTD